MGKGRFLDDDIVPNNDLGERWRIVLLAVFDLTVIWISNLLPMLSSIGSLSLQIDDPLPRCCCFCKLICWQKCRVVEQLFNEVANWNDVRW